MMYSRDGEETRKVLHMFTQYLNFECVSTSGERQQPTTSHCALPPLFAKCPRLSALACSKRWFEQSVTSILPETRLVLNTI